MKSIVFYLIQIVGIVEGAKDLAEATAEAAEGDAHIAIHYCRGDRRAAYGMARFIQEFILTEKGYKVPITITLDRSLTKTEKAAAGTS